MSELSSRSRSLIAKAREGRMPTAADRYRVRAALAAALAPPSAPSQAPPSQAPPPATPAAATSVSLTAKVAVTVGVGTLAGSLIVAFLFADRVEPSQPPEAPRMSQPSPAPAPSPAPIAQLPEPAPLVQAPVPERDPPAIAPAPVLRSARTVRIRRGLAPDVAPETQPDPITDPDNPSTVAAQLALVTRATRAIQSDPREARRLSTEYLTTFPRGAFFQEAQSVRALTGCTVGEPGARAQAEDFLARFPSSAYATRVRRACGVQAANPPEEDADHSDTDR